MMTAGAAELLVRKYQADGEHVVRTYQNLRFDKHLRLMREHMHLKEGTRILDVGCGTGALLVELAQAGAQVTGIDTFEEADGLDRSIAKARCREYGVRPHMIEGTAAQLPFRSNWFDILVSVGMLEHIAPGERSRVLRDMFRVISPGGYLLLIAGPTRATPFDQHIPGYPLANWLSRRMKVRVSHLVRRRQFLAIPWAVSRRELRTALPDAQFKSLYADYFALDGGQPLGPFRASPLWVLAWMKRHLWLRRVFALLAGILYLAGQEHCHILSIRKADSKASQAVKEVPG
jgi:ubiquinone/menaquinone biosynthesis C-methylase UbiE